MRGHRSTLAEYERRWDSVFDLAALCTVWLLFVPFDDGGLTGASGLVFYVLRTGFSVAFGIDVANRIARAPDHLRYALRRPSLLVSVLFPPLRLFYSVRLLHRVFQRGNLRLFLIGAAVMIIEAAVLVYFFERSVPDANITTMGDALWWAAVTVATVGYGDTYPVTLGGRLVAVGIMALGVVTIAMVTAHIASSFMANRGDDTGALPWQQRDRVR